MYLVYGAGKKGCAFLNRCAENNIKNVLLTDSNAKLWGEKICGYKVINPNKINFDEIRLVIVCTGDDDFKVIKKYLSSKVNVEKIAYYQDVLLFSSNDVLNIGNIRLNQNNVCPGIYRDEEIVNYFDENTFNDLDRIFYQSQHRLIYKWVHYTEAYDRFFSKYRGKKITVLEIGVYQGGSLQMWKEYFGEEAQIIGLDINAECKNIEEKNIKVYIGDQGNRDFLRTLKEQLGRVDIIIDDGGHRMDQQIISFEELFEILADDGIYLCEDCHTSYWPSFNGGYKKEDTFIEYSKRMIDGLNVQHIEEPVVPTFNNCNIIKSLTFYDGLVFIEKKEKSNRSFALKIDSRFKEPI